MTPVTRGALPAAATALAVAILTGPAVALDAPDTACRDFIATKVRTLADAVLREEVACNQKRALGSIAASADCNDATSPSFPGAAKVASAATKLTGGIASKCAGAAPPAGNGYTACAAPCDGAVPSIASYADVASCLVCLAKADATTAMRTVYGTNPPVQGDKDMAWKCQNVDLGKGTRSYVKARLGARRKCQHAEDKGTIGATDCSTADLSGAIGKAGTKLATAIGRCTDTDLGSLTSCASTTSAEQTCLPAAAKTLGDALFAAIYPEPPTPPCPSGNFLDVSGAPGPGGTYSSLKTWRSSSVRGRRRSCGPGSSPSRTPGTRPGPRIPPPSAPCKSSR